ncbi:putative diphthamide synthesis protein-domain-containing protein [Catenaria anguillulae PL171]|uniref:2-(3-amino-3-carboxypropyl)histidine synthase subunit 2 n=1 Tax=Catenaria anguillulae PL171 TaxID=765915 RepID=A0A1Y2I2Y1_9FUNG|nr:putative diphthamide synthesis protein-domain-containing protein [Catenaria anguillulae PL171]
MHFSANCVVHFGRSCLSGVSHMPVLYAFGKLPVDVDHAIASLEACLKAAVKCDRYVFADVVVDKVDVGVGFASFKRQMPTKDQIPQSWPLVVIAPPGPLVAHYSLVLNQHPLYHYNPLDSTLTSPRSTLMKRYALMQKARDASVIGIVVGTLGVANYLSTIASIKRLIRAHHKKYYTFVLGKLNVPKLANFMDIDVFVLVACPESSLIDSREFYKPVVTPFELGMALDLASEWTGEYRLAFGEVGGWMDKQADELLAEDGDKVSTQEQEDKDSPYFSLVTGTYVQRAKLTNNAEIHEQIRDLTLRDEASMQLALQSPAAQRLAQREWKGLDTSVPREEKSMAVVEGRFGNAAGYSDEPGKE